MTKLTSSLTAAGYDTITTETYVTLGTHLGLPASVNAALTYTTIDPLVYAASYVTKTTGSAGLSVTSTFTES